MHERSVETDLLLLALRRALAAGSSAKVVLMSATVPAAPYCEYFAASLGGGGGGVAVVEVPGRTYPVEELFLEDAVSNTGYACAAASARDRHAAARR